MASHNDFLVGFDWQLKKHSDSFLVPFVAAALHTHDAELLAYLSQMRNVNDEATKQHLDAWKHTLAFDHLINCNCKGYFNSLKYYTDAYITLPLLQSRINKFGVMKYLCDNYCDQVIFTNKEIDTIAAATDFLYPTAKMDDTTSWQVQLTRARKSKIIELAHDDVKGDLVALLISYKVMASTTDVFNNYYALGFYMAVKIANIDLAYYFYRCVNQTMHYTERTVVIDNFKRVLVQYKAIGMPFITKLDFGQILACMPLIATLTTFDKIELLWTDFMLVGNKSCMVTLRELAYKLVPSKQKLNIRPSRTVTYPPHKKSKTRRAARANRKKINIDSGTVTSTCLK